MKLFLHWFRHDLRRFRLMLGFWTLLVAAYASLLAWIHLRILTVSTAVMESGKPLAILLAVFGLLFLFLIFQSDPAEGTRPFWKTRPVCGRMVAGSKLALALIFFLALPLLAWGLVNALAVPSGHAATESPSGLSWTGFLFWTQSMTISVFALAAARARNGARLYLRLLVPAGTMLLFPPAVLILLSLLDGLTGGFFGWHPLTNPIGRWLWSVLLSPGTAALMVAAGGWFLIRSRRRPLAAQTGPGTLILLSAAVLAPATAFYRKPVIPAPDESLPPAAPGIADQIRVQQPARPEWVEATGWEFVGGGGFQDTADGTSGQEAFFRKNRARRLWFSPELKIEGLPPGALVSARWLDLRLDLPGGRLMPVDSLQPARPSGKGFALPQDDHRLSVEPATFLEEQDAWPPAVHRGTATGTLRLILHTPQSQFVPFLLNGQPYPTRMGLLRQEAKPPRQYRTPLKIPDEGRTFMDFSVMDPGWVPTITLSAENTRSGLILPLNFSTGGHDSGFLINRRRTQSSVWVQSTGRQTAAENFRQDLSRPATAADWRMILRWHEPSGVVDLPVTLHDIIVRTGLGGKRPYQDALAAIHPAGAPSPEKLLTDLYFAAGLLSRSTGFSGPETDTERLRRLKRETEVWKNILSEVPHDRLPVLLEFLGQSPPFGLISAGFHKLLTQRIGELLQPADLPAILANPALAAALRDHLPPAAPPPPDQQPPAQTLPAAPPER